MKRKDIGYHEHRMLQIIEAEAVEALAARKLLTPHGDYMLDPPDAAGSDYASARAKAEQLRALVDEPVRAGGGA